MLNAARVRALVCAVRALFLVAVFLLSAAASDGAQRDFEGAVAADDELAARAGMEILRRGGNAVDAAVATAFALAVVDPASSGIGGGGFMVLYQARARTAHVLDFRERAPAQAHRDLYIKGGKVVPSLSLTGGLAVAVPSQVSGLAEAVKRFGTVSWPALLGPAIRYAREGFPLKGHLRYAVERQLASVRKSPALARIFLRADGTPLDVGEKIVQAELAETLSALARQGPQAFYDGPIAQAIVEGVKKEGGVMTLEDLKSYRPVWREPLLGRYRSHVVIAMPPPSSGGVALLEMLRVLESYPLESLGHNSATYLHLLAETMKHAFADRAQYLGDPDFVQVPVQKLISKEWADKIRAKISAARTYAADFYGPVLSASEKGGTTHFSILDGAGNAVACTVTINTRFGSKVVAPGTGIILNNEMDDFSIQVGAPNTYGLIGADANAIQPKKRPLSSMSPTIILENDRPALILGGAGGPRIISAVLQTVLNVIDFGMPVDKAVEAPRIHHQWMPNELAVEPGIPPETRLSLERRGHAVRERENLGVVQAIVAKNGKVSAKADPRKEERGRR
ncbi:MAG TPA: gamma-glutamyltransferase [Candidatus Acidoferrales bacterium]|nr:gamma-glutamyltransferase [Candidatus Acidoferrales bacterium]